MPNAPVPEVKTDGIKKEVKMRELPAMPEGIDSGLFFEKMRGAKGMVASAIVMFGGAILRCWGGNVRFLI